MGTWDLVEDFFAAPFVPPKRLCGARHEGELRRYDSKVNEMVRSVE